MADLRERLVGQAFAPDDDALLVHVDTAVAVFADWLRDEAAALTKMADQEEIATVRTILHVKADALANRARALTHPDTKEAS